MSTLKYKDSQGVWHRVIAAMPVAWSSIVDKPSWIGSSKPTYAVSEITGLATALAAKQNSLGTGTNGQILSWDGTTGAPKWIAAPATGVTSFGGQTGAITLRGSQTAAGSVNLAMNGTQLQASIVGLGSAAYTASSAYATATQGSHADTAYGWGNHAGEGYLKGITASMITTALGNTAVAKATDADTLDGQHASYFATASSLGNYLPKTGGTITGNLQIGSYAANPKLILQDSLIGDWALQVQDRVMKLGFANGSLSLTYGGTLSIPQAATIAGNTVYHSGNCNNTSTPWSCSNLTASGNAAISGNVGIGTSSPSAKFHMVGDKALFERSGGCVCVVEGGSSVGLFGTQTNHPLHLRTNYITRVTIGTNGDVSCTANLVAAGEVTAGSDARWKHNIKPISESIIDRLIPCEWDWKEGHGNGHSAGFVAQDVAKVLPYAVKGNEKDGFTLNYNVFHAFEVKMLQSHETEIDRLRKRVAYLEKQLNIKS